MAIGGVEWLVVGAIAVVILLWGPERIPQIARYIGTARREFDLAQKELSNPVNELLRTDGGQTQPSTMTDDELLAAAHQLGIATKGMTREELKAEVAKNVGRLGAGTPAQSSAAPPPAEGGHNTATADQVRVLAAARQLGLSIDGKTEDQVKEEIRRVLA